MLPLDVLLSFFAASVVLGLAPGPDNIFVLSQSMLYGRAAGLLVTLGLCSGLLLHTAAVTVGVAALLQASAPAFNLLKALGAAYLLYLAWQALRASGARIAGERAERPAAGALYRRGILMNISNPKVLIFFLAFLPQFVDPHRGSPSLQMMGLGGVFIVATLLVFGSLAWLAGSLGGWLSRSERIQRNLNRVAAALFVGLAVNLLLSTR